jgi:hypothetical protein
MKFTAYLSYIEEHLSMEKIHGIIADFYKNPYSAISKMMPWARGIVNSKTGDLYVVDYEETSKGWVPGDAVIHADIAKYLNDKGIIKNSYRQGDEPKKWLEKFITVQRLGTDKKFILAESYDKNMFDEADIEFVVAVFELAKEKNPGIEFDPEINEY